MPLGESMLSVLKSNKNVMLDKGKHFRKTKGRHSKISKTEYDFPKVTSELLLKIKEEQLLRNKKTRIKNVILFSILVLCFIIFYYCKTFFIRLTASIICS